MIVTRYKCNTIQVALNGEHNRERERSINLKHFQQIKNCTTSKGQNKDVPLIRYSSDDGGVFKRMNTFLKSNIPFLPGNQQGQCDVIEGRKSRPGKFSYQMIDV